MVVVILVGMGSGDSRMETAAVEGILGDAEDEPLTMTCRFVDLSAERRLDGGAKASAVALVQQAGRTLAGNCDSFLFQVNVVPLNAWMSAGTSSVLEVSEKLPGSPRRASPTAFTH